MAAWGFGATSGRPDPAHILNAQMPAQSPGKDVLELDLAGQRCGAIPTRRSTCPASPKVTVSTALPTS